MTNESRINEDEIDVLELLSRLWAHKIFIIFLTLTSIGIGFLHC